MAATELSSTSMMTGRKRGRGVRATALMALALALMAGAAVPASAASPGWRAIAAVGPTHLEHTGQVQRVGVLATGGTFSLTFAGSTTPDLPFDASAEAVQAALNALPSISAGGGSVKVTRFAGGSQAQDDPFVYWLVTFRGASFAGVTVSALTAASGTDPLVHDSEFSSTTEPEIKTTIDPSGVVGVYATNVGGAPSSGTITMTIGPLPAGVTTAATATGDGWSCLPAGIGHSTVTCTSTDPVAPGSHATPITVPIRVADGAVANGDVSVSVQGGGAGPDANGSYTAPVVVSDEPVTQGVAAFWAGAFDADGRTYTQAGGHPALGATMFLVNTKLGTTGLIMPVGDLRDVAVDLPAGFVGNPTVTPRCPVTQVGCSTAEPETIVGRVDAGAHEFLPRPSLIQNSGLSNDTPQDGYAAQFTYPILDAKATILATLRSESDFGVTATAPQIPTVYTIFGALAALQGSPVGSGGKAFLTNPTDCGRSVLPTLISVRAWQLPQLFSEPFTSDSPAVVGCDLVPFDPTVALTPTSDRPDSASGLDVDLHLPQDGLTDPNAIATSHLKKTVVKLPEGFSVNPSGATGLAGCSDVQVGLSSKAEVACPDASKLGTVSVTSPLVDQALSGEMYLGTPKSTDPMSGEMLRLFLVVRNERYGLLVKLPGSATADPVTGRLTATFDNNPRLPFDDLKVKLRGGDRGLLATGQRCGDVASNAVLSPWSGTDDVSTDTPLTLDGNCAFGFAPKLKAGMSSAKARDTGTFSFSFSREDGEQWIDGLIAKLPDGLLASVKDVALCTDAQAAAGACPAGSRIGTVDATAGTGNPFVLERKGQAFLTEGYKGCAYGLAVVVPVIAGPFDATTPETDLGDIVVRQSVCVDPTTAQVTVTSDPLPTIWHGVPLRVRSVTVLVDRDKFMLNPSDCTTKQVGASFDSAQETTAGAASPFSTTGCATQPFKPNLTIAQTGRKQTRTGKHPGIKAKVTQTGIGEAGIEKAVVRLPKSLALDPDNAQALCEFEDGTKDDLENHCPKGSIVGRARATTPLLNDPLVGNVYFVKNIRKDANTGNTIRTLPMIIVALRGEIAVNLKGESSTTKAGKLVNTFANVPDAPISQFNLNIKGGKTGILAVTRTRKAKINLCAGRHIAEVDNDGQNGRRHDFDVRMKTPCSKRQVKRAKRAAKQAARRG